MGELMLYKYLKNLCATQVSSEKLKMTCLKPLQSSPALITPKQKTVHLELFGMLRKGVFIKAGIRANTLTEAF